jgi:MFS family permease
VSAAPAPGADQRTPSRAWRNRTVVALGLASLFSDAGHETATAVLPLFLATLGGSAAALGLVEGVADALSTAAKLASGWCSDGLQRRKPIAVIGYAATGFGMAAFALAQSPLHVLGVRTASWVGRGMRGPPRDAMLAEAVPPDAYGRAFGFHRAMDTAGAVVGPLLAFALAAALGYRTIFALTLIPGIASVIAFASAPETRRVRTRLPFRASLRELPQPFRRFLVAVGIFGLGDFARSLLILRAAEMLPHGAGLRPEHAAIGLYVLHNLVHALSAYGIGVLGSRFGSRPVLAAGYAVFALMCLGFVLLPATTSIGVLVPLFTLAGIALATEEVLEGTVAAELLPERVRGTGFGVLAAVNGVGDLVASIAVGWLWAAVSPAAGFAYAGVLGALGAVVLAGAR